MINKLCSVWYDVVCGVVCGVVSGMMWCVVWCGMVLCDDAVPCYVQA